MKVDNTACPYCKFPFKRVSDITDSERKAIGEVQSPKDAKAEISTPEEFEKRMAQVLDI